MQRRSSEDERRERERGTEPETRVHAEQPRIDGVDVRVLGHSAVARRGADYRGECEPERAAELQ